MKKGTSRHFKTLQGALVTIFLSLGFTLPAHAELDSSGIYKSPTSSLSSEERDRMPNSASFKNNILSIEAVDSVTQPGQYQDVVFQLTEQGEWQLLDYKTPRLVGKIDVDSFGDGIKTVEVITTDAYPIQAFLKISSTTSLGCAVVGKISQRLVGNTFQVSVYSSVYINSDNARTDKDGNIIVCSAAITNHTDIIGLPVYGLPAGEYTYNVNGEFSGSFNLTNDNELIGYEI